MTYISLRSVLYTATYLAALIVLYHDLFIWRP